MNLTHSNTMNCMKRGSLWLAGVTLLGLPAAASDPAEGPAPEEAALGEPSLTLPQQMNGLKEAILGGTFWMNFRYRYENVDDKAILNEGHASTLRSRLGYETADFHGFSGVLEFSNVAAVPGGNDGDYNDGSGNPADRGVVLDPAGTVVNQVYARYTDFVSGEFRIGRQRINLDNERFIGGHDWRQTEQVFDSLSYSASYDSGVSVFYGYLDNQNTIFQTNQNLDAHLLNVGIDFQNIGTLAAYGYYLDFSDVDALSTFTYGARFFGNHNTGQLGVLYGIEYAHQDDTADNPNDVSADYSHAMLGVEVSGVTAKVGFESLDGVGGANAARAFQTPLASLHEHNGFADQFLITPASGLEDIYVHGGYDQGPFGIAAIYHQFDPERGTGKYGNEFDIVGSYEINEELTFGVKFADFNADSDSGLVDTTKYWLWLAYSI